MKRGTKKELIAKAKTMTKPKSDDDDDDWILSQAPRDGREEKLSALIMGFGKELQALYGDKAGGVVIVSVPGQGFWVISPYDNIEALDMLTTAREQVAKVVADTKPTLQ